MYLPLLQPAPIKGIYGGRGSGKSHFAAEKLVEDCILQPGLRAVCIREFQKSTEFSSKQLIEDKIRGMRVGGFKIRPRWTETPGDGIITYEGMQDHTADSIKSLEGFDRAWWEEAQTASKRSLRLLLPTFRKDGAEVWFTWNPEHPDDPIDELLRGPNRLTYPDALVVEASWRDNPFFPEHLRKQMEADRRREADDFDHVWDGGYVTIADSIIFAKRAVIEEFETPEHVDRFFFGADWGFANDPTAVIRSFIRDETLLVDHEAYGKHVELDDLPALFAGGRASDGREYPGVPGVKRWPIKGDSSRPETISYMRRQGFNISPAEKWQGCVEDGIAHLKGFKRIVIHPRCQNLEIEKRRYSYKVDKKSGDVLPIIVDAWNHGWDAIRYSLDGYIMRRGGLGVWTRL